MRRLATLTLLVLLAGCSGSPDGSTPDATAPTATGDPLDDAPPRMVRVAETLAVAFDGVLGTGVHGCVFPANACETRSIQPDESDLLIERPGTNLTALSLDVTWTPETPATQTLTFGYMVMATCDGCNDTFFGEVTGPSPLHIQVDAVDVPLTADAKVHVYAYNPSGFVFPPGGAGYAVVSVAQGFHIEGTATVATMQAATSSDPAA